MSEREIQSLQILFNRAKYPVVLRDEQGEEVYTIPTGDDIDSIVQMPEDDFISIVMNDVNRPWRIKVLEYSPQVHEIRERVDPDEERLLYFR